VIRSGSSSMPEPSNEQINIDEQLLPTLVVAPAKGSGVTLAFTSGNTYAGDLAGTTTMHGAGAYKWAASGVTYVGDFAASAMTGKGKYAWPDGSAYEGEVKGGIRHGFGTFCGPGGFPRYEGQWVEGRRHGKGLLVYSEGGDVYEGDWANDVREGQGTLTHASGNTYTGSWSNDQKNGHGVFEWKDRRCAILCRHTQRVLAAALGCRPPAQRHAPPLRARSRRRASADLACMARAHARPPRRSACISALCMHLGALHASRLAARWR
jgi:hypothetical protein